MRRIGVHRVAVIQVACRAATCMVHAAINGTDSLVALHYLIGASEAAFMQIDICSMNTL
jgi:hypothetical protein